MKRVNTVLVAGLMAMLLSTCYYDSEEELYPSGSGNCNTDNVSFTANIVPMLESRCYKCHSQALRLGNVVVEGYSNVKLYVNNGQLLGSIKHQSGYSAMPQNESKLSTCDISKVEKWIQAGAPEN